MLYNTSGPDSPVGKKEEPKKSFFKRAKKEEEVKDTFSSYISKVRSTPFWDDTNSYRQRKVDERLQEEERRKEEEKKLELKEQKKEGPVEEKKPFFSRFRKEQEEEPQEKPKLDLDSYLNKRKGKRFYFAERHIEQDLRRRRK